MKTNLLNKLLWSSISFSLIFSLESSQALPAFKIAENLSIESAIESYSQGKYKEAIEKFKQIIATTKDKENRAIALSNIAATYKQLGQNKKAIKAWEESLEIIQFLPNNQEYIVKVTISLSNLLIDEGKTTEAISRLSKISRSQILSYQIFGLLGRAYYSSGAIDLAIEAYKKSLNLKQSSITLINLSNAYLSQSKIKSLSEDKNKDLEQAKNIALKAIKMSKIEGKREQIRANINFLKFAEKDKKMYAEETIILLNSYPDSSLKIISLIDIAKEINSIKLFKQAISIAEQIGDRNNKFRAYFRLAELYLNQEEYEKALGSNNKAIMLAESQVDSIDLFRSLDQNAKIFLAVGDKEEAIKSYDLALWNLKTNRGGINNLLFQLQTEAKPFLRNYIILLLEANKIEKALQVLPTLKLIEFQDYFNDPCFDIVLENQVITENNNLDTATIYTFIAPEKLYSIIKYNNKYKVHTTNIKREELLEKINIFRQEVVIASKNISKPIGKELYATIIAPIEEIIPNSINKFEFVRDEALRIIPFEALVGTNDRYLIQKYQITYLPGLPSPVIEDSIGDNFVFGLSESQIISSSLKFIEHEVREIAQITGGKIFKDDKFTKLILRDTFTNNEISKIHIATHGNFSGNANTSYLEIFNGKLSLTEFKNLLLLLNKSIYLLTLSGCETAVGNQQATLGFAGMSVRARIRNVLASLWAIPDDTTSILMEEFYKNLSLGKSVAEAKQSAQIALIDRDALPRAWAGIILISNY